MPSKTSDHSDVSVTKRATTNLPQSIIMDAQSRQEYVRAAISFLQNPKLVDSPLKDKLKFLKDKGLSELEVDEALNLALINRHQTTSGKWNFVLILGLCIGGYKLYQTYLEQESARREEHKTMTKGAASTSLTKTNRSDFQASYLGDEKGEGPTLNEILQKMSELKRLIELQRSNFGTEMQSLKTLLLGHEKFAAPPKIPEWQLASAEEDLKDKDSGQNRIKSQETNAKKKKTQGKNSEAINLGLADNMTLIS